MKDAERAPAWWSAVAGGLIFGVVALVFQEARHGAFLAWDDDINITNNPHLTELSWERLRWMFSDTDYMRRYVPLAWLGWVIERTWFGLTAQSAHVGNILLHVANAVLAFLLVREVLRRSQAGQAAGEWVLLWAAAAGSLCWAVHPLRVEVVAWASGRLYCQAIFFLLLATLAYLQAATSALHTLRRRRWMWVAWAGFTISLLTYPLALGYVAVLLVTDVGLLRRWRRGAGWWADEENRAVWVEKIPFVLVTLVVLAISVYARLRAHGIWDPPASLETLGVLPRVMRAFYVWGYFGWKPFSPVGLSPVYTTLLEINTLDVKFVLSAVGVVGCTGLLYAKRREWPGVLALWFCHLALLVPLLGLTEQPYYPSDRYSYLAGLVWSVAGAVLLLALRWRVAVALTVVGIGAFGFLSVAQVRVWRDSEALFRHVLGRLGDHWYRADPAFRLGEALRAKSRFDEAAEQYRESLRVAPTGMWAHYAHVALGRIARAKGARPEAEAHYRRAIELRRNAIEPYLDWGDLLMQAGEPAEAAGILGRAVEVAPNHPLVRHFRGTALLRAGAVAAALAEFEIAVRLAPDFALAHYDLGLALRDSGRKAEAVTALTTALRLKPNWPEAREELARLQSLAR